MLVRLEPPEREAPLGDVEKAAKMQVLVIIRGGRAIVPTRDLPVRWPDRLVVLRELLPAIALPAAPSADGAEAAVVTEER